jgi:simple sugar transport system ATP-binding protein
MQPAAPDSDVVLSLQGITKRFGALTANDAISLDLAQGQILGLLGENGAGKSTLMSILFGHYTADDGQILVHGQALPPGNPGAALAAGIGMVHQHFALADNLSVLDNILLGTESLWRLNSQRTQARAKARAVAQRFGLSIDTERKISELTVGERQRVEIIKALYRGARILILDEPTSVLTPQESEHLFETLLHWVREGLSIIFISHKLGEVLRVCDRVAVLRHGKLVADQSTQGITQGQLAQWMVGHELKAPSRRPGQRQSSEPVCRVSFDPAVDPHPESRDRLHHVNLSLYPGEIVAVAGVSGNGQTALCDLLFKRFAGAARIPEDRQSTGLIGDLPVWENVAAERLKTSVFSYLGWVKQTAAQKYAQDVIARFDVRGANLDTPARNLSGGNMQKLILGRALTAPAGVSDTDRPTLIVAQQPTWGLDIGAVAFVHDQLIAARDAGAAVLLVSDDLDEVMTLGDQIAVMHAGVLSEARSVSHWTRESIGLAMAGIAEPTA